jgi:hypothetical protein
MLRKNSMSRLFKRRFSLTIAKPRTFFTQGPEALIIRSLHCQFQVEKHLGKEPNTCTITIDNLSDQTRSLLDEKPIYVRLEAGYDIDEELLFEGDLRFSESLLDSSTWVTRMEVGDGERAFRQARVNRSFTGPCRVKDAVSEVISCMGGFVTQQTLEGLRGSYSNGVSLEGPCERELTRLLSPLGKTWSIQNGLIQILGIGEVRKDQAALISQDKGMIGSPSYGSPPEKGKPATLTVKNLLYPSLLPGGLINVSSQDVSGLFKLQRVSHDGDTHGPQWETQVEATQ